MLTAIPQTQLIDEDGTEGEPLRPAEAFGGNLPMHIEDGFELLIQIFIRNRVQRVKDAAHPAPIIVVRRASILRGNQHALFSGTAGPHGITVVMAIAQAIAHRGRHLVQEDLGEVAIGAVGGGAFGDEGHPDRGNGRDQMQFPAVPARFGPMRLGINRTMRHCPGIAILLVPDATIGAYDRLPPVHRRPTAGSGAPVPALDSQSVPVR